MAADPTSTADGLELEEITWDSIQFEKKGIVEMRRKTARWRREIVTRDHVP